MRPVVEALMTLRGVDTVAATTLVAEIGDFTRFARPPELMGFLGLVPSAYNSGDKRQLGKITKTGNSHARRVLVEAAWNYRFPARMSTVLQRRQEGQPKAVRQIAWRAQLRLARRYRRLSARKLALNKICVAIARELSGFIWDIACGPCCAIWRALREQRQELAELRVPGARPYQCSTSPPSSHFRIQRDVDLALLLAPHMLTVRDSGYPEMLRFPLSTCN